MHLFLFRSIVAAILGTSHCLVYVLLTNTVLLGAPMLPTRWVKMLTYLQSETFLSITFILINLKVLIISVHTTNVLCYVVLVISAHLRSFLCLFVYFSVLMCFSPVLACNLCLTLYCLSIM
jgi:hypothetical protein